MVQQANQIILPGEHKLRNFRLEIPLVAVGLTVVEFDDLEEKILTELLPDKTRRSGGVVEGGESSFKIPAHHKPEKLAIDAYYDQCRYELPGYKRDWTISFYSGGGVSQMTVMLVGAFLTGKMIPGGKLDDSGNPVNYTLNFAYDQILNVI